MVLLLQPGICVIFTDSVFVLFAAMVDSFICLCLFVHADAAIITVPGSDPLTSLLIVLEQFCAVCSEITGKCVAFLVGSPINQLIGIFVAFLTKYCMGPQPKSLGHYFSPKYYLFKMNIGCKLLRRVAFVQNTLPVNIS